MPVDICDRSKVLPSLEWSMVKVSVYRSLHFGELRHLRGLVVTSLRV